MIQYSRIKASQASGRGAIGFQLRELPEGGVRADVGGGAGGGAGGGEALAKQVAAVLFIIDDEIRRQSEIVTVQFQGWSGKQNGELISLIDGKFDVFLTGDKNLRYQQRIETRSIAIVEVPFTRLDSLNPYLEEIRAAIPSATNGSPWHPAFAPLCHAACGKGGALSPIVHALLVVRSIRLNIVGEYQMLDWNISL